MYWRHDRGSNAKSGNRAGSILKTSEVDRIIRSSGYLGNWKDADTKINDKYNTFTEFNNPEPRPYTPNIIDHIYYLPNRARALTYETDINNYTGSDHLPVFTNFRITNTVEVDDPIPTDDPTETDNGNNTGGVNNQPGALILPPNTGI
jgi:hypothetical protein